MSYQYEDFKDYTFSDKGQRNLIDARDFAFRMINQSGCVRAQEITSALSAGDSWQKQSVLDRLVELRDLIEVKQVGPVAGQHRIFISGR